MFTNPDRAIRILRLRAVMHHLVYFNPYNWALEHYIGLILKYLVDQGDLSMNTLLYEEWGEIDIDRLATAR